MNRARPSRRQLAIAGLAVALPLLLAGCGFDVQTNKVYQPAVGANNRAGAVDVLGAVIVSPKTGQGAFLATLVDNSDSQGDQLVGITANGAQVGAVAKVDLAPQTPVNLADQGGGIAITGSQVDATKSNYVELTLEFANADPVRINVPVVVNDGPYAEYGNPSTSPSSSPTDGAS